MNYSFRKFTELEARRYIHREFAPSPKGLLVQDPLESGPFDDLARDFFPSGCKTILEIGAYRGANTCLLSLLCSEEGIIVSIEPELFIKFETELVEQIISPVKLIHLYGFSTNADIYLDVLQALNGNKIDILFIDGDHGNDVPFCDLMIYLSLLSSKSIVAMHDIVKDISHVWPQIRRIFQKNKIIEIISPTSTQGLGIIMFDGGDS